MCSRHRDVIGPAEIAERPVGRGYLGHPLTPASVCSVPSVFQFSSPVKSVALDLVQRRHTCLVLRVLRFEADLEQRVASIMMF